MMLVVFAFVYQNKAGYRGPPAMVEFIKTQTEDRSCGQYAAFVAHRGFSVFVNRNALLARRSEIQRAKQIGVPSTLRARPFYMIYFKTAADISAGRNVRLDEIGLLLVPNIQIDLCNNPHLSELQEKRSGDDTSSSSNFLFVKRTA